MPGGEKHADLFGGVRAQRQQRQPRARARASWGAGRSPAGARCAAGGSASGALELVPWVRETNLARALEQMKQAGFWIAGLDAAATQTLAAAKLSGKVGLVLGSEGGGLRRLTRELCDLLVGLPQSGKIDSLNVSNAAAVALYEMARR